MRGPGRPLSRACLCLRPLSSSPRAPRSYRLTAGLMGALKFPPEKSAHLCHRVFSVGALGRTQLRTGGSPRAVRRLVGTGRARRRRPRGSRDRRGPPGGAGAATPLRLSICYFRKLKAAREPCGAGPRRGCPRKRAAETDSKIGPRGSADPPEAQEVRERAKIPMAVSAPPSRTRARAHTDGARPRTRPGTPPASSRGSAWYSPVPGPPWARACPPPLKFPPGPIANSPQPAVVRPASAGQISPLPGEGREPEQKAGHPGHRAGVRGRQAPPVGLGVRREAPSRRWFSPRSPGRPGPAPASLL